jgi:hypothetical protein
MQEFISNRERQAHSKITELGQPTIILPSLQDNAQRLFRPAQARAILA